MLHDRGFHLVHERYIIRDLHRIDFWRMLPCDMRSLVQHIFGACDILDGIYHSISSSNEGIDPTTTNPPPYPPSTLTSGAISTSTTSPPQPPSPPPLHLRHLIHLLLLHLRRLIHLLLYLFHHLVLYSYLIFLPILHHHPLLLLD